MVVGVGGPPADPEGEGTCCMGDDMGGKIFSVLTPLFSGTEFGVRPLNCDWVTTTGEWTVNVFVADVMFGNFELTDN